jgi:hypothetical protein
LTGADPGSGASHSIHGEFPRFVKVFKISGSISKIFKVLNFPVNFKDISQIRGVTPLAPPWIAPD